MQSSKQNNVTWESWLNETSRNMPILPWIANFDIATKPFWGSFLLTLSIASAMYRYLLNEFLTSYFQNYNDLKDEYYCSMKTTLPQNCTQALINERIQECNAIEGCQKQCDDTVTIYANAILSYQLIVKTSWIMFSIVSAGVAFVVIAFIVREKILYEAYTCSV